MSSARSRQAGRGSGSKKKGNGGERQANQALKTHCEVCISYDRECPLCVDNCVKCESNQEIMSAYFLSLFIFYCIHSATNALGRSMYAHGEPPPTNAHTSPPPPQDHTHGLMMRCKHDRSLVGLIQIVLDLCCSQYSESFICL